MLIAPDRLTRASHKQSLTKAYARAFVDEPIHRNKYKESVETGRQRNRPQMKEEENSPEDELDEMDTNNLSVRQCNDYKDTQQHEKRHRNHKKGAVRDKECNV